MGQPVSWRPVIGLVAAAVVVAGCGTTVRLSSTTSSGLNTPPGVTSGAAGQAGAPSGGTSAVVGTGATSVGSAATTEAGGQGSVVAGSGASAPVGTGSTSANAGRTSGQLGPGVTAKTIAVGCPYYPTANTAVAGMGGAFDTGNELGQWKAVLDDLNAHGGVMGRQVACVFHPYDTASEQNPDSMYQSACADWTQDHHVLAVLDHPVDYLLPQCAASAGSALIMDGTDPFSMATHQRWPGLIGDSVNIDRTAVDTVTRLHSTGFLTATSRIGVLYATDEPDVTKALPVLQRQAQALGLNVVTTFGMPELNNGQAASDAQAAALRFAQDRVDRVLSLESGGGLALYFMIAAHGQHYYPRYGWNSQNNVGALLDSGGAPADEFTGSRGVGWQPIYDISYANNPASRGTVGRQRCLSIMRKAGLAGSSYSVEYLMEAKCDKLWLFAAALGSPAAAQYGPSRAGLVAGIDSLGTHFTSALTLGSDYTSTRHDGVAVARDFAYLASCSCLRYTSSPYALG